MTVYHVLRKYATQLTSDSLIAHYIAEQAIDAALTLRIMDTQKAWAFMITETRNKCYEYNRWRGSPEGIAENLGVSIGEAYQVIQNIRSGRFF